MPRNVQDKLASLPVARRSAVEREADRLHADYVTMQQLRKARNLTQVQLAERLGIQQATVAKYERQSDLLLSTLTHCVQAMGGSLKLLVEFPGQPAVVLAGLGEAEERPRRRRVLKVKRKARD